MELILYTADCTGIPSNCVYPHEVVVDSKEKMAEAIEKDHVCAKYKNNYRSNENFMEANGFFMDNDNDHTDNPAEFITAEKLSEMLADVGHVIVPSRHNMLPKGSKPAKPRQHIYFPCQPYKDSTMYAAVKRAIQKKFPFLDDNAMDAARFFFGSSCDADDIIWNEGFLQIDVGVMDAHQRIRIEDDGEILLFYDTDTNELLAKYPVTEGTGQIFKPEGNNNRNRVSHALIKQYFAEHEIAQEFIQRMEQEQPKYFNSHCIRLNRMTKFYSMEQMLDGVRYCIETERCNAYELLAYMMYKHGEQIAKKFLPNQQYFNHLTRSKEIRREIDG